jgi:hypothetical protein
MLPIRISGGDSTVNETGDGIRKSALFALRQKWLLLLAALVALALLAAAIVQWKLIPKHSGVDEIKNYATTTRLPDTACFTSLSGVVLAIFIVVGRAFIRKLGATAPNVSAVQISTSNSMPIRSKHGYFKIIEPVWSEKPPTNRGSTIGIVLIIGIMLLASTIACFAAIIAAFNIPDHMKTVKLNNYTYHLAHRPTSDWDANEILLYECVDSGADCHMIHRETTRNLDGIDLRVNFEANTIFVVIHDSVVFEYQPPLE